MPDFKIYLISKTEFFNDHFDLCQKPTAFDLLPIAECFVIAIHSLSGNQKQLLSIGLSGDNIDLNGEIFQAICIHVIEKESNQPDIIPNQFNFIQETVFSSIKKLPEIIQELLDFSNNLPAKIQVFVKDQHKNPKHNFYVTNSFEQKLLNESRKITGPKHPNEITVFNSKFGKVEIPLNLIASKTTEVSDNVITIYGYISGMIDHHRETFVSPKNGKPIKVQMNDGYPKHRNILDVSHQEKRIVKMAVKITHEFCAGETKQKSYEFESLQLTKRFHPKQNDLDLE